MGLLVLHFLHVCGGDPTKFEIKGASFGFSPRMWR